MTISKDIANTIVDPEAYANWELSHGAFTELRRTAPLAVAEPDDYDPFWVVTKFDDIQAIEKQNDLFHNRERPTTLVKKSQLAAAEQNPSSGGGFRTLVHMDNPDHFKHRILTQGWFMPQNLRKLEDRIREIAREFVDNMLAFDGECDFAKDVAFLYPLRVVMEVIGVPQEDETRMLKLTQELFGQNDPDLNRAGRAYESPEERMASMREVFMDFINYFTAMSEDRRQSPREDLATVIANAEVDGEPIGFGEAMGYYIIAATAGHDTTSATTAGTLWTLAERPDLFDRIRNDMSLLPNLIEESIRWESPVKHFMRTAMGDTEIRGQKISEGDWLMLCYPSGNRDEEKFDNPFEFSVDRDQKKHVAFGYGAHVCLGQHLARMEMRVLWEELFPKLKSVELSGEPARMIAAFVCGPKRVPIRFQAA